MHGDQPRIRADGDLHDLFLPLMRGKGRKTVRDLLGQVEEMRLIPGGSEVSSLEIDPKGMVSDRGTHRPL
jgi:hypothetical protein